MAKLLALVCGCALAWAWSAALVRAQGPLRAVVFRTACAAADADVASAVDLVVLGDLDARGDLEVSARPALDLPATQIAIDCIGETHACWSAVLAQYAGADVLIAPSIQRAGDETIVTFLYVDPRGDGAFRTIVGRYRGADVAHQALDAVPSMLRALLNAELPPDAARTARGGAALREGDGAPPASATASATSEAGGVRSFPIVPVALLASAIAIGGTGLAFGLAAQHNQDRYDDAGTEDARAVDAAIELRDRAHRQATIANVAYGAAALVFTVGATLLVVDMTSQREPERAQLAAALGPHDVGVVVRGALE
jgi:hypothetical protein